MDYEKAMELDETLESAYLGLANVYVQQGEADKALEILRQGLERTENSQLIADKLAELEKISESDTEHHFNETPLPCSAFAKVWS